MYTQSGTQSGTYTGQQYSYNGEQEQNGDDDFDPDEFAADPKKKGRGESFNMREDELLGDAWLATSIDLIQGT